MIGAVRLRSGRDRLERAVQQIYPLELSCDIFKNGDGRTQVQVSRKLYHIFSNQVHRNLFRNVKQQSKQRNGYVNYLMMNSVNDC